MSQTIDQKVVEMRFDNKNFESNVSTTMSTLDKLKQKLHFKDASKSLEGVSQAANKVDFSKMEYGATQAGFQVRDIWLKTASMLEEQVAGKIINAGKKMISALTIDPIKTGLTEYETQINATQTILANTKSKGSTLPDVNTALEELNAYADMTIYNFTEMTRNIGTFTAAGVDLETSVGAIQGIANLAAVSGSTSQQASTAMYQLSQALSSGTVKLMDWNSVVNAGMGGEVFQNALKKTSKELGTGAEAAIKAAGSFRESLKDGWLTADVLTETLKRFTTSGANEYLAEYTGLTEKVIEDTVKQGEEAARTAAATNSLGEGVTEEAYALEYASKILAEKSGKNQKEIKDTLDLAKTATGAATEVKTFTQLWDVMKEAAQSGWAQSWKIIIGDFEEAKKLLTPLANVVTGFIGKMNDARNWMLEIAFNFTAPWKAITDKLSGLKKVTSAVETVTGTLEYFQDVVNRVWMGEFNNWGDNPDRRDLLTAAGYDQRVVQYLVNLGEETWHAGKVYQLTMADIEAAHKHFGLNFVATEDDVAAANQTTTETIYELDDAKLKDLGLTEDEIKLYRALQSEAKKSGKTMQQLAEDMSTMNGRDRLIDAFKNIGSTIGEVFRIAKDAYKEIFNPPGVEVLGIRLFGIIQRFQEFTQKLKDSMIAVDKDGNRKLTESGEKLMRTFKGIFAAIHLVYTILSGPFKIAFKIIKGLFDALDIPILDFTASLGDVLVAFDSFLSEVLDFEKMWEKIFDFFKNFSSRMSSFWNWLKDTRIVKAAMPLIDAVKEKFKSLFGVVKESKAFKKIGEFFKPFVDGIKSWWDGLKNAENIPKYLFEGLWNGIKKGATLIWDGIANVIVNLIEIVKDLLGIHSPSVVFMAIGGFIIAGLISGITNMFPEVGETLSGLFGGLTDFVGGIDWGSILGVGLGAGGAFAAGSILKSLSNVTKPLAGIGDLLSGTSEFLVEVAPGVNKVLKGTGKFIKDTGKGIKAIGKGIKSDLKAEAFATRMEGIMTLVKALVLLAAAVLILGKFCTVGELVKGGLTILVLAGILFALSFAVEKISKSSISLSKNGLVIDGVKTTIMSLAISLLIMGLAVKMMASLSWEELGKGLLGVLACIVMIGGILAILGTLVKGKTAQNMDKIGKMMTKMAIALLLMALVMKIAGGLEPSQLLKGVQFLIVFLAFFALVNVIAMMPSKNVSKLGGMMLKMSLALILMVAVFKFAGSITPAEMLAGIEFLLIFAAFVGILMVISLMGGSRIKGLGTMLLGISISMLLLIGVMKLVGMLSPEELTKGLIAIVVFGALIIAFIRLTGNAAQSAKVAVVILAFSVAIGILAFVAIICGLISTEGLIKGVLAVSVLSLMMALMVAATKNATMVTGTIIAIAVAIAVMVACVAALTLIDPTKLAIATVVMTVLTGMLTLLIGVAGKSQKAMGSLIALSAIVLILAGVIMLLSKIPAAAALAHASILSGLILVLTGVLALLIPIGKKAMNVLKGVGLLAALCIPLSIIATELIRMSGVEGAKENAEALGVLLTTMTVTTAVLALLGKKANKAIAGVAALTLLVVPLLALVGVLYLMNGLEDAMGKVKALSEMLLVMTACLAVLTIVGSFAVAALAGIGTLAALIVGFGVLAGAIGALITYFPSLETFLDTGINIMVMLAGGIGEMIGAFIKAIAAAVMEILPALGAALSGFMTNLVPFIVLSKMIDGSVLAGIGWLAAAIIALTGAELLAGIASLFGLSLVALGLELSLFMKAATPFFEGAKKIDVTALEGINALAEAILMITAANLLEGIMSFLGGGSSLEDFAKQLPILGRGLQAFSNELVSFTEEQLNIVTLAAQAVKTLAQAAEAIPNTGGLLASIVGENDLGAFADQFPNLGRGIVGFLKAIEEGGGLDETKMSIVKQGAEAVKIFAEAAKEIPNSGGWIGAIFGENDMDTFAEMFPVLGKGLVDFLKVITEGGGLSEEQMGIVQRGAEAVKIFADAANYIPSEGGIFSWLDGESDLESFASKFPQVGEGLRGFVDKLGTFDEGQIKTVNTGVKAVQAIAQLSGTDLEDFNDEIDGFKESLLTLATGIIGFNTLMSQVDGTALSTAIQNTRKLMSLFKDMALMPDDAVKKFSDDLGLAAKIGITNFINNFAGEDPKAAAQRAAIELMTRIVEGFTKSLPYLEKAATGLASKTISAFKTRVDSEKDGAKAAGQYFGAGLVKGINSKKQAVYDAGKALGEAAVAGEKKGQKSNSPSKLTMQAGHWFGEGLVIGIDQMGKKVYNAGYGLGDTATKALSSTISRISDMVSSDIDSQPTIRPVLDLSDVESGTSALAGMLNMNSSIGVRTNVGAISSMMNDRSQNGANSDVISALDKLGKKMDNINNASYTINGITYDDGSNITDAVKTLVRAARIERRV